MDTVSTVSAAAPGRSCTPATWHLDADHGQVRFHTRAMFGLFPVLGRIEQFDGGRHPSKRPGTRRAA